jgi:glycosyltransferase involved in cell wall biosynthesis
MIQIKVLFFGKLPPPYIGPSVATGIILNSELKNRFELIHFDTSHHSSVSELGRYQWSNFRYAFRQYIKLFFTILKKNPDIIYIPSQQTTIAYLRDIPFILISKFLRKKVVCHLRGGYFKNWYQESGNFMKWVIRRIQSMIDGQIVLGENLRPLYSHLMPVERIYVIPNGSDYDIPSNKKTNDKLTVLYLGNFIESKGLFDVLNACFHLPRETWSSLQILFAGNWHDEVTKKKFLSIIEENPDFPVKIIGPVYGEDKFKLLSSSDIFVFPSFYRNEGHPWVIVEAMASSLPIISTNHAAIPESVLDNKNGFLVKKRNPKEIAGKIQFFLNNPDIRVQMGKESRNHYEANFSEKKIVENFTNTFNSLVKKK